ncbi:DegV family EDD domain-containing protein [Neisseria sp. Dent CA1/247]|uniref:DegV family protein n=1 Tax=Neisseria sp. Dent CA1/247 TaxID=2912675 RepID=UPI001FD5FF2A|nr:DegV family protein [Neisseria sp. Dent CA1/247]UOO76969.1 DegV family EDD domain-containing protein [Neisseria sp. Dent CA1/247]
MVSCFSVAESLRETAAGLCCRLICYQNVNNNFNKEIMMAGSYSLYRCAVLSTSTGMLDSVLDRNSPIDILRLRVHMHGQSHADGCNLKAEEFFDWMREHPDELLTTSPPNEECLRKTFRYLKKQGYHEAIVTTISSKLSESFNVIRAVAEEMADDLTIHVFDTGTTCMPEGFFALEALRLLTAGKSSAEVLDYLERLKPRCELIFGVQSLTQLARSDGLMRMGAAFNDWLGLKTVLRLNEKGVSHLSSVAENEQMIERIIEALMVITADKNPIHLVISGGYCGSYDLYQQFAAKLHQKTGLHLENGLPVSPAIGVYAGLNAVGVGIVERLPE